MTKHKNRQQPPCDKSYVSVLSSMPGKISEFFEDTNPGDIIVEADGKKWWYLCSKCDYKNDRLYHSKMHFIRVHVKGGRGNPGRRKFSSQENARTYKTSLKTYNSVLSTVPNIAPVHTPTAITQMKCCQSKRHVREEIASKIPPAPVGGMYIRMTFGEFKVNKE